MNKSDELGTFQRVVAPIYFHAYDFNKIFLKKRKKLTAFHSLSQKSETGNVTKWGLFGLDIIFEKSVEIAGLV